MPGPGLPFPQTDRLIDAQGDEVILTRGPFGPNNLMNVLAVPDGFGVAQTGPFFTFVYVLPSQGNGSSLVYGDTNAFANASFYNAIGSPGNMIFVMQCAAVMDFMVAEDQPSQDAFGLAIRFTATTGSEFGNGAPQTTDMEQWMGNGSQVSGIDCNANLYATLIDINQDVFPCTGSAFNNGAREGMLGWDYTAHTPQAFDGAEWNTIVSINTISGNLTVPGTFQASGGTVILGYSGLPSGTLASPPAGLLHGQIWIDTTDSANYPKLRWFVP